MSKRAPQKETLNFFNDIKGFLNKNKTKEEKRQTFQMRDNVKMPFKMYKGIKNSVIKKSQKNADHNQMNNIIGESGKASGRLMTNIINKRIDGVKENRKNTKLMFSHGIKKARFRDGVMKIGKAFIKDLKNTGNTNNNHNSKPKGGKRS